MLRIASSVKVQGKNMPLERAGLFVRAKKPRGCSEQAVKEDTWLGLERALILASPQGTEACKGVRREQPELLILVQPQSSDSREAK